ncbi:class I SAM-dependent methyltransferase [Flavihumibacter solisilvae]|uniref:Methyltransferase type 12 n=1 Tax=Flavihumibacter solisilvae TaxID=1349421 RepID=A0A0C1L3E5_9BACT|nr:class I SAM-dependent methyltransferase [Flavihumibacter solisilvae]KIC94482.1 methyltransferase type 12 [Flavihumibacter solisilvae]
MAVIHYTTCPVCDSTNISPVTKAKDHTVSGETFIIWECADCRLRFTQDVPDSDSIGPYYKSENYISHSDTSKGMVNRLYHLVRNHTLRQKRKLLVRSTKKRTGAILDIGAGTGAFLNEMKQAGWRVTGLEPDAGARAVAAERYSLNLLEPSTLFQLETGSFDAITMWHVLEHVHTLQDYIKRVKELLKPGGWFIIALPNYTSLDAMHYGEAWAAYDVPRHLYHFSPESVKQLLQRNGLTYREGRPMWFDSFYISMLSEQYLHGKPGHVSAFIKGLTSNKNALSNKESASSLIYLAQK